MLQYLFDTDHLTLFEQGQPLVGRRLALWPAGAVGITVVSVEEALRGRLARVARAADGPARIRSYALLTATIVLFDKFTVAPYDQVAEAHFQHTSLRTVSVRRIGR